MNNYRRLQQAFAEAREQARKFMENIALMRTVKSLTYQETILKDDPVAYYRLGDAPGPMLPYLDIFTPALLYFIDCALKDWEMAPEDLCELSCEPWLEAHILHMKAETPQGIDGFYWFITKFDYDIYFQLHV